MTDSNEGPTLADQIGFQISQLKIGMADRKINHEAIIKSERAFIKEPLKREDVHDPVDLVRNWAEENGGNGIIAFGESNHHGEGTLVFEKKFVEDLNAEIPVKKVFLEEDENMMPALQKYYETGKMPSELEEYLKRGFVRGDWPNSHKYNLVVRCKELGIPVQFIDKNSADDRDADWTQKIGEQVGDEVNGLYVLIAGKNHVMHSELYGFDPKSREIPVVNRLDKKYPGKILSMHVQTGYIRDNPVERKNIIETKFLEDLTSLGLQNQAQGVILKESPYEGRRMQTISDHVVSDAYDLMVNVPGALLSPQVIRPPFKYQARRFVENIIEGPNYNEHYHKYPIKREEYARMAAKNAIEPVTKKEKDLMNEFLRSEKYRRRKDEIDVNGINPRILYLAAGDDAIPSSIFGYGNVVMTGMDRRYNSPYQSWAHQTLFTDKMMADMFNNPMADASFSTLVINGIQVFSERLSADNTESLFGEMRRVAKPDGVVIVTNYGEGEQIPTSGLISKEKRRQIEKAGWKIEEESYTDQMPFCRLKAVK